LKKCFILIFLFASINLNGNDNCKQLLFVFDSLSNKQIDLLKLDSIRHCSKLVDNLDYWLRTYRVEARYKLEVDSLRINLLRSVLENKVWKSPTTDKEKKALARTYVALAFYQNELSLHKNAKINYAVADSLYNVYKLSPKAFNFGYFCLKPLANIYTRLGDYEKSIQTFKKAEKELSLYEANPRNFASLYLDWGRAYNDLGEYDKEIALYKKGKQIKELTEPYVSKMDYVLVEGEFNKYIFDQYRSKTMELEP